MSRAWCRTPLIPALGRQRQADFWVWGQPGLQSDQDSQGYTEKPCLKKQTNKKQNKTKKTKLNEDSVEANKKTLHVSGNVRAKCQQQLVWQPTNWPSPESKGKREKRSQIWTWDLKPEIVSWVEAFQLGYECNIYIRSNSNSAGMLEVLVQALSLNMMVSTNVKRTLQN